MGLLKKNYVFLKLLQRVHTQRPGYAAHMSFIAHIWKVVLTTSPRLFCISFPVSHSPASGGPVRQPRPTKNMEKPMESLTLSDPTRSTCGNTTAPKTDRFGGGKHLTVTKASWKLAKSNIQWYKITKTENSNFDSRILFKLVGWLCSLNHDSSSREHFPDARALLLGNNWNLWKHWEVGGHRPLPHLRETAKRTVERRS